MNIEVCKKCSRFPDYFIAENIGFSLYFTGILNKHMSGCLFSVYRYGLQTDFRHKYKISPEEILPKVENKNCPYKFEHEILR